VILFLEKKTVERNMALHQSNERQRGGGGDDRGD
jgi:hypothetical protein